MKILINAANVRFGGGVTVAKNIIRSIIDKGGFTQLTLLLPRGAGYDEFEDGQRVRCVYVPDRFHTDYFFKWRFVQWGFSKLVDDHGADVVFSLGNVAFPCAKPHLLLIQNAYLFYPESVLWQRLPLKFRLYVRFSNFQTKLYLKKARHYLVQTTVIKNRLQRLFGVPASKIGVLPNVVSYQSRDVDKDASVLPLKNGQLVKLLFLSKYYPHKNYDILVPLAQKIKAAGSPLRISLTLDVHEAPRLAANLQHQGLDNIVQFMGNVPPSDIGSVFAAHQGVFLPTLLESFSGTYVEAMFYGRPVFTSNMDFAHVVCGDAAYYFDPLDADDIFKVIATAYAHEEAMALKIAKGYQILSGMPTWQNLSDAVNNAIAAMMDPKPI
ncbi:MAG: glycosyltransferase [Edaphocola sp.]